MSEFVIARNPDPESALPYLLRLPLATGAVVLKARETWPRTAKVYCHRATDWPENPEIVERVSVRTCVARGASINLVLDRTGLSAPSGGTNSCAATFPEGKAIYRIARGREAHLTFRTCWLWSG